METAETPVPVSATDCGLEAALSVIESAPVLVPAAVGVNITEMVQEAAGANVMPQVLVCLKSPLMATFEMVRAELPAFDTVTVFAALATFCGWLPKSIEVADRSAVDNGPTISRSSTDEVPPPGAGL